jgi:RNA polymerase sigma factor (sigma-70 family)
VNSLEEKTVEDYLYLVDNIVASFMPDKRKEDFQAVGMLALVECFPNRPGGDPIFWLVAKIKWAIYSYIRDDHTIRIPDRSLKRHGYKPLVTVELLGHDEEMYDDSMNLAIADLPVEDKELVWLLVQGYTFREIAEQQGTNAMAINRRVKIIRNTLITGGYYDTHTSIRKGLQVSEGSQEGMG